MRTDKDALKRLKAERLEELRNLAVEPFVKELDKLLEAAPKGNELAEFAANKPNDWANMVKTFAGLAGYAERQEIKLAGIIGQVKDMSDAQLVDVMQQLLTHKKALDFEGNFQDKSEK